MRLPRVAAAFVVERMAHAALVAGKDWQVPEKLRERIIATCGALTPEQQQLMVEFIWLRAHGPQEEGERSHKRLTELLDTPGVEATRITAALQEAVAQLQRAMADSSENGGNHTAA